MPVCSYPGCPIWTGGPALCFAHYRAASSPENVRASDVAKAFAQGDYLMPVMGEAPPPLVTNQQVEAYVHGVWEEGRVAQICSNPPFPERPFLVFLSRNGVTVWCLPSEVRPVACRG